MLYDKECETIITRQLIGFRFDHIDKLCKLLVCLDTAYLVETENLLPTIDKGKR